MAPLAYEHGVGPGLDTLVTNTLASSSEVGGLGEKEKIKARVEMARVLLVSIFPLERREKSLLASFWGWV